MIFWEKQKVLTSLYEYVTKPLCNKYGLTQMEYDIVMFLHNNSQYKTASDIVKIRKLTKSHVSNALSLLEKKGYIKKHYESDNKKSLILQITESANNLIIEGEKAQLSFGRILFDGFSNTDIEFCKKLFSRMCENANKVLTTK